MPKISLVFLTYNRLGVVARCLRSLAPTLALPGIEWLILDNASDDGMAQWGRQLACNYPDRVKVLLSAKNTGVAGGRALLFEQAKGDVIISMDSDVEAYRAGWLTRLLDALNQPGVWLAGPAGAFVTDDWRTFRAAPPEPGEVDVCSGYCQAFKREVLDRGIVLDQAYNPRWHEDAAFCLDIRASGGKVWHTGNIGLNHIFAYTGDDGKERAKFDYFRAKYQGRQLVAHERNGRHG